MNGIKFIATESFIEIRNSNHFALIVRQDESLVNLTAINNFLYNECIDMYNNTDGSMAVSMFPFKLNIEDAVKASGVAYKEFSNCKKKSYNGIYVCDVNAFSRVFNEHYEYFCGVPVFELVKENIQINVQRMIDSADISFSQNKHIDDIMCKKYMTQEYIHEKRVLSIMCEQIKLIKKFISLYNSSIQRMSKGKTGCMALSDSESKMMRDIRIRKLKVSMLTSHRNSVNLIESKKSMYCLNVVVQSLINNLIASKPLIQSKKYVKLEMLLAEMEMNSEHYEILDRTFEFETKNYIKSVQEVNKDRMMSVAMVANVTGPVRKALKVVMSERIYEVYTRHGIFAKLGM